MTCDFWHPKLIECACAPNSKWKIQRSALYIQRNLLDTTSAIVYILNLISSPAPFDSYWFFTLYRPPPKLFTSSSIHTTCAGTIPYYTLQVKSIQYTVLIYHGAFLQTSRLGDRRRCAGCDSASRMLQRQLLPQRKCRIVPYRTVPQCHIVVGIRTGKAIATAPTGSSHSFIHSFIHSFSIEPSGE